jgi:hypothetical protein
MARCVPGHEKGDTPHKVLNPQLTNRAKNALLCAKHRESTSTVVVPTCWAVTDGCFAVGLLAVAAPGASSVLPDPVLSIARLPRR